MMGFGYGRFDVGGCRATRGDEGRWVMVLGMTEVGRLMEWGENGRVRRVRRRLFLSCTSTRTGEWVRCPHQERDCTV
jgi:hypothetical protein